MILRCNFEELRALRQGAGTFLRLGSGSGAPVVAPPEGFLEVERLLPRLSGDLVIETLAEQRMVCKGVTAIVELLRAEMDLAIASSHPGDEAAVSAYFVYAHALAVEARLAEMGGEMEALIEVVTGGPVTPELAARFQFPG